jgi:hypothetical protein
MVDEEVGQFLGFHQVGLAFFFSFQGEKGFEAFVGFDVVTSVAGLIKDAFRLNPGLELFMRQEGPVNIKVDHVVVAGALIILDCFQLLHQGAIGAGSEDVDLDGDVSLEEGFNQRAGNGAVADIAFPPGAGGDHKEVDGGGILDLSADGLGIEIAAHHCGLEGQWLGEVGVFEGFPVEGVEVGGARDLKGQVLDPSLEDFLVAGIGFWVSKDLVEEGFAVGGDAGCRSFKVGLVGEGEAEMSFEVPLQKVLLIF